MPPYQKNPIIYTIYSKEVVVMPNSKQTSAKVASKASKILSDGRYSKTSKLKPYIHYC